MNCPVCHEAMIVLEHEQVEIDHCLNCKGNWLDQGELELILEDPRAKHNLLSSFEVDQNSKEQKRKCPICSKKMEKVLCGSHHTTTIDQCPKRDGLWFDLGELDCVIKMEGLKKHPKVQNWLKGTFGKIGGRNQ